MLELHEGQCGLCSHFGEHHPQDQKLVQIRASHRAPEDFIDECGRNGEINLKVTPISGCDGFEPVQAA